ncbi:hypothetical protein ACFLZU_04125 [Thermodesulfobacteriota bacterium]
MNRKTTNAPTDDAQKTQAPHMGTALRSFLKRYARELQPYAETTGDRVAASMIDCCNHLLLEANRLGGRNEY